MNHIRGPERTHKNIPPRIPSLVFLGEMPYAKELRPNRFPKISPPLSAYHDKQKVTAMYLGLKKCLISIMSLLDIVEEISN